MRRARVFPVVGLASVLLAGGCSAPAESEFTSSSQALLAEPILNEVLFNPQSTDNPYEYIEIKGNPGASLNGYQVLYVEGDAGASLGVAKLVTSLAGAVLDANGLLVIGAGAGAGAAGHTLPAGAGIFIDTAYTATNGCLENGTGSFILVKGAVFAQLADYDTNDDGILDLPANGVVVDSIAVTDGGLTDRVYGPVVIGPTALSAVTRFSDDDRANTLAAWYGGGLAGTLSTSLAYDPAKMTGNAPSGSPVLTPGGSNFGTMAMAGDGGVPAVDAGVDAGVDASADASADSSAAVDAGPPIDASYPPNAADPYLNEIEMNPDGTDNPYEYIELKGAPGASLTGYQVVYLEGDTGTQLGVAKLVFHLTGATFGSGGLAVLKSNLGGHTLASGASLQSDNAFDVTNGALENGTGTFLLLRGAALAQGTDYDANDDGTLELPAGAVIVDGVATTDGGAADRMYAAALAFPAASSRAFSRVVGTTLRNESAVWFGGGLASGQSSLAYDMSAVTANTPANASLTPGGENSQGAPPPADAGSPVVDAGVDSGIDSGVRDSGVRDAAVPVVDSGNPVVDSGVRDAAVPVVDSGVRDAAVPVVDAGVRDAGAATDARPASDGGLTFAEEDTSKCNCSVVGSTRGSHSELAWAFLAGFIGLTSRRRRAR